MTENKTKPNADAAEETVVAETKSNRKSLILKVLILAVVLVAIAAMWFAKNASDTKADAGQAAEALETGGSADTASVESQNADFALEAEAIDLAALLSYKLPIIIDFGADSCVPCKMMAPVLVSMNAAYQGRAIIKFVDVWKHSGAANDFPVQVIPTQVFINADGTPYVPSKDLGVEFGFYSNKDTQEHVFTVHQGGLTEEQMEAILADMGVSK
jgi:thioredoxin 1